MGLYFLATLLLMKISLPYKYRPVLTEVLKAIRLDYYNRWFDLVFVLGAIGGLIVIKINSS
jgi:hypothetical protein